MIYLLLKIIKGLKQFNAALPVDRGRSKSFKRRLAGVAIQAAPCYRGAALIMFTFSDDASGKLKRVQLIKTGMPHSKCLAAIEPYPDGLL